MMIISKNNDDVKLCCVEENFGYDKHSICLNCQLELLPHSVYSYHGYCPNCVDMSLKEGVAPRLDVCLTSGKSFYGQGEKHSNDRYVTKQILYGDGDIEHYCYKGGVRCAPSPWLKLKRGKRDNVKAKSNKNLRRARRTIQQVVKENFKFSSSHLILTYEENMQDFSQAKKDLNYFMKKLNKYRKKHFGLPPLKYTWVAEKQIRGAIHFHIVIYNWTRRIAKEVIEEMWGHGFIKIKKRSKNLGNYLSKYVSKENCDFLGAGNQRIYSSSIGLGRPSVTLHSHWLIYDQSQAHLIFNKDYQGYTPFNYRMYRPKYNKIRHRVCGSSAEKIRKLQEEDFKQKLKQYQPDLYEKLYGWMLKA